MRPLIQILRVTRKRAGLSDMAGTPGELVTPTALSVVHVRAQVTRRGSTFSFWASELLVHTYESEDPCAGRPPIARRTTKCRR
jgi:hypothetical protein